MLQLANKLCNIKLKYEAVVSVTVHLFSNLLFMYSAAIIFYLKWVLITEVKYVRFFIMHFIYSEKSGIEGCYWGEMDWSVGQSIIKHLLFEY